MGAWMLTALLAAGCSSPPTAPDTPSVAAPAAPAAPAGASASPATALPGPPVDATTAGAASQVDASQLPEDVRDFIVRQRMCRHFRAQSDAGQGSPQMATAMCAGADETAWKALVRKYQGDDTVASVLLAERPAATTP